MAYRMTYLRINSCGYASGWQSDADKAAFKEESRKLFQELGWTLQTGESGVCDTVTKGQQELYLHPTSFSGVLDESTTSLLQEQLSNAQTFQCYAVDCYEEYTDLSDDEYRAALEAKRNEITAFILEQCKTKRTNLFIVDSVPMCVAQHFEICRLCDKDRINRVGNQFMSELVAHLVNSGQLVTAETDQGIGIRTATAKELKASHQPAEQIDGQCMMMF